MEQFRPLEQKYGEQVTRNAWGEFTEAHKWFRIPLTIETAGTFVRDELKAYSIEAMHRFNNFSGPSEWKIDFEVVDIPLVARQDSLLERWWNKFTFARTFKREEMFWDSHRFMVLSDSLDPAITVENVPYLRAIYAATPPW